MNEVTKKIETKMQERAAAAAPMMTSAEKAIARVDASTQATAADKSNVRKMFSDPPAGNQLGALAGAPKPHAIARPELRTIVALHFDEIIQPEELAQIKAVLKARDRERDIQNEHSGPVRARKESAALEAYSLNPSDKEARKILTDAKLMSEWDHSVVGQYSRARELKAYASLDPLKPIFTRAAKILEEHAGRIESSDAEHYAGFALGHHGHPLVAGLRQLANEFRGMAGSTASFSNMPELFELLAAK